MKNFLISLVLLIPLLSMADARNNLNELSSQLNLKIQENGKCHYKRSQLTNIELGQEFNTHIRRNLVEMQNEDLEPYWNCIFLKRNFRRDSRSFFIPYDELIQKLSAEAFLSKQVRGKIRYVGLVSKKYKYDVTIINGVSTLSIKIHFDTRDFSTIDAYRALHVMDRKIQKAENYWNSKSPSQFRFHFKRVKRKKDAFFSVRLKQKWTRGPYDTKWSVEWSDYTVAHEFGHMMGLDDEYDQITASSLSDLNRLVISRRNRDNLTTFSDKYFFAYQKAANCDQSSLMCNSSSGEIRLWHLYSIFKRVYQ